MNGKIPKLTGFRFEDPFQTAFKLPPERALEWLKQRGKNLKLTTDWDELDTEAHDKAFTVAKVMNADILQLIYDYVERAKTEGWTSKEFQSRLLNRVQSAGWTGATPSRLKVIYDTNMQMAYANGKYRQQKLIAQFYPYWKYTQIERPTKRHNHSLLHNKMFWHDDPIWDLIYPPSGFGCKCSVTPIKDGTNAEDGSTYLRQLRRTNDFSLHPAFTWKADTSKYVKELRTKLDKMLKTKVTLFDKILKDEILSKKITENFKKQTEENLGHHQIAEMLGFTEKPQIKAKTEIDKLNSLDYYVCYRGLNGLEYYEQFKYGEYFSGRGIFGCGTYAAVEDIDLTIPYTNQKQVMKILFPKNANIVSYKDVNEDFAKIDDELNLIACKNLGLRPNEDKILLEEMVNNIAKLSDKEKKELSEKYTEIYHKISDEVRKLMRDGYFLNDVGNYALLKGYDAIIVEDRKYIVIMNRSKCIVQKENEKLVAVEFSEKKVVNMPADLSRRLGKVWGLIPHYNNVKAIEVVRMASKIASIQKFEDLPEEVQKWVVVAEQNIGEDND
ncbi:MAG: phage head morphosis protein [Ignavibacteria bacterium]|nr:phage head morphosis protein [Ignavibacteria bacterium]